MADALAPTGLRRPARRAARFQALLRNLILAGALLGACWAATYLVGGAGRVAPHWFYAPILLAAARLGYAGAFLVSGAATVLAGPLMPLDVQTGAGQAATDWLTRGAFFVVNGQLMAWAFQRYRRTEGALRSTTRSIATLLRQVGEQEEHRRRREEAHARIRTILEGGAIRMVFQPIVDLRSGSVVGLEALARFDAEPRRSVAEWLAEAHEVGLGHEVEVGCLNAALGWLDRLPKETFLAVNLSPETISTPAFAQALVGVPADRVVVEVTEHAPVRDYEILADALSGFRAGGTRLAVDDAGSGFASLRHILRLSPDLIKLDVELTRHIHADSVRRALAAGLVSFASELGSSIVAEGIETKDELETLRGLGVRFGQGFFLARPDALAAFDFELLRASWRGAALARSPVGR